ncbi:GAK system CofD-like protein [Paucidesulfovibrio longus]|uniref:GAK system CofD-like protein n=1 Tax=Paucidesulfovibrio longus TaxID=889 RepID=UPI0003B5F833|nr:GAK system CofD-like protein [Paucidesulfovibrio longus]
MSARSEPLRIRVSREVRVPDRLKLERYRHTPALGPRVLFFSGGTALRDCCSELVRYTHNSVHVITPFDSGGSSAVLRKAFAMPAVGDIRNRLMALADTSLQGNPEIFNLFAHRLSKTDTREQLIAELESLARGRHRLIACVHDPMRKIIRNHFREFIERMPDDFDLRGASLGNLVLTAGFLANRRHIDPVIFIFSKLVRVLGMVRPVVNKDLHLAVRLADGKEIVGQHMITGKESAPLQKSIADIWTVQSLDDPTPVQATVRRKMKRLIGEADLICFPIGSFYTSVLANLLVAGVGSAVAANACPKVYVPNTLPDPECVGLSVADLVERLLALLRRDAGADAPVGSLLNAVLVDSRNANYPGGLKKKRILALGVEVIDLPLVQGDGSAGIDPEKLVPALMSLT